MVAKRLDGKACSLEVENDLKKRIEICQKNQFKSKIGIGLRELKFQNVHANEDDEACSTPKA